MRRRGKPKTGTLTALVDADDGTADAEQSTASKTSGNSTGVKGYGPRMPVTSAYLQRPKFTKDWPVFEVIFLTHLRQLQLSHVLSQDNPDSDQNIAVYNKLILCLDHKSIKAICNSSVNDGKAAWKILREKYLGDKTQRKTNAVNDLASLLIKPNKNIEAVIVKVDGIKKILYQSLLQYFC